MPNPAETAKIVPQSVIEASSHTMTFRWGTHHCFPGPTRAQTARCPRSTTHQPTSSGSTSCTMLRQSSELDAGQIVLAWMTQRRRPVVPIVGVSTPAQVRSAWSAVNTVVSAALMSILS